MKVKISSKYIEQAVEQLSSLPGIGKRTALRLVLQLLNRTDAEIELATNQKNFENEREKDTLKRLERQNQLLEEQKNIVQQILRKIFLI